MNKLFGLLVSCVASVLTFTLLTWVSMTDSAPPVAWLVDAAAAAVAGAACGLLVTRFDDVSASCCGRHNRPPHFFGEDAASAKLENQ